MAKPVVLQDNFSLGMKSDYPVEGLPRGAVLNMVDFIPGFEGGCAVRDRWNRTGSTLGNTYVAALAVAPFAAGPQLVGITDTGAMKQVPHDDSAGANTSRGTANVPNQQPVFYRDKLYITNNDGATSLKSYDGSSNAAVATGSPPAAMYGCVYKDHLVLGRTAANSQRVWFSNGGDAGVWDTAADGQWFDASYPITGMATLRNMFLVFAEQGVERVRGDIIPGIVGSDMVREPLSGAGCADAFSIAVADDFCVFANADGVHLTDGIGFVDLTAEGGISRYWQKFTVGYSSTVNMAGALHKGKYILAVHDQSTLTVVLVCDIKKRVWYELTNIPAYMFASAPQGLASYSAGDLFMAERDASWIADVSPIFNPYTTTNNSAWLGSNDDNGTTMAPRLRTGFFTGTKGLKRLRDVYVSGYMQNAATVTVSVYTEAQMLNTDETTVGTMTQSTTDPQRKQYPVNKRGYGLAVEIQSTAIDHNRALRIDALEADMRPLEASR